MIYLEPELKGLRKYFFVFLSLLFGFESNAQCALDLTVTGVPTACNPTDNSYAVSGSLTFTNPPASGSLSVSIAGMDTIINSPFVSPQSWSITGLNSDGATNDVTAVFSLNPACADTVQVMAPNACADVDVELTVSDDKICQVNIDDVVTSVVKIFRSDSTGGLVNLSVRDSLTSNFAFVSATPSSGSFDSNTGMWTGISIAIGDTATLSVEALVLTTVGGFASNIAWVMTQDRSDIDSSPGNMGVAEDDSGKSSVSIPIDICGERNEQIELSAPPGYATYQWTRNGMPIAGATGTIYLATEGGEYNILLSDPSACPFEGCCPIIIVDTCECPPVICVPLLIQKTN